MLAAGQRISFAGVAREANVSTWFVYNSAEVKTAIWDAMQEQTHHGVEAAAAPRRERATPASLHTDLALAREEIQDLKRERDVLKQRVQLALARKSTTWRKSVSSIASRIWNIKIRRWSETS